MNRRRTQRRLLSVSAVGFALCLGLSSAAVAGPPGMDPRMMSGIPRPEAEFPPGTITVRCLNGTFAEPAVGAEVTLELTAADGVTKATRKAAAVEKGRATFGDLGDFAGGVAIAKVTLDGEALKSQPILVNPQTGTAVMLVKGASELQGDTIGGGMGDAPHGAGAGAGAGAGHGMPELREGVPFPLPPAEDGQARAGGTLVVGVIEPAAGAPDPRPGITVLLEIHTGDTPGDEAPEIRKAVTDDQGRAAFEGLAPPALPEGAKLIVEAQVVEGEPPRRSAPFEMGEGAMAMIFTPSGRLDRSSTEAGPHGGAGAGGAGAGGAAPPVARVAPVPPPRPVPGLAPGVVEVAVVDGSNQPVQGQKVTLIKRDLTGRNVKYHADTSSLGIARFEDVEVRSDAFYMVASTYQGAPYQSSFFELLDTMGHRVALRVFPTTDDAKVVRSAVQFELRSLENDFVQVLQSYEVLVEGTAAYWPEGGMRVYGAEGARNLKVLPSAKRWLEEQDAAPFAKLAEPIEPGQVVELSIAYVLKHDGEVSIEWNAPFPVVQAMAVLGDDLELTEGAAGPGERPPHDPSGQSGPPPEVKFYPLEKGDFVDGPCELGRASQGEGFRCSPLMRPFSGVPIQLSVSGLTRTAKWDEWTAVGLGVLFSVLVGVALVVRPRVSRRRALEYRRDLLLHDLAQLDAKPAPKDADSPQGQQRRKRRNELVRALDQVYRQLDVLAPEPGDGRG